MAIELEVAGVDLLAAHRVSGPIIVENNGYRATGVLTFRAGGPFGLTYAATVVGMNPVAYYRLGEGHTYLPAVDLSPTANNGTYYNTPYMGAAGGLTNDPDTAVAFASASSEYMEATTNAAYNFGTGAYSISFLFKRSGNPAATEFIVCRGDATNNGWEAFMNTGGQLKARIGALTVVSAAGLADGAWHHAILAMNRAGYGFWTVDGAASGAQVDISGESSRNLTNTDALDVARRPAGNYFNGSLDEMAVFPGYLTAGPRAALWAAATRGSISVVAENPVLFHDGPTVYYGGLVKTVVPVPEESMPGAPAAGPAPAIPAWKAQDVECQDYTILAAMDVIPIDPAPWNPLEWTSDKAHITNAFAAVGTKGITVGTECQTIESNLVWHLCPGLTLAEFMDEICQQTGGSWYVDYAKALHYFLVESEAAPFGISDVPDGTTTFLYDQLVLSEDSIDLKNAVLYIPGKADEPQPGDAVPTWYTDDDSIAEVAAASGDNGRRETSVRDDQIMSQETLDAYGAAFLAANGKKRTGSFICYQPGLRAGMTVPITSADEGLVAEPFSIVSVRTRLELPGTALADSAPVFEVAIGDHPVGLGDVISGVARGVDILPKVDAVLANTIADLSVGGGNLVQNSSFENALGTTWTVGANWTFGYTPTAGQLAFRGTKTARAVTAAQTAGVLLTASIPVNPLDHYWASLWTFVRARTSGTMRLELREYNAAAALVASTTIADLVAAETDWTRHALHMGPTTALGQVAFNIATVAVRLAAYTTGSSTLTCDVDGVQVERGKLMTAYAPSPQELIDGQIGTTQIALDAITSDLIASGAVDSTALADLAVATGKLQAGAVSEAKLADLAVATGKIQSGAISAAKIAGHTITAAEIAALTITAAEIAANTITGGKIAAYTIEAANIKALTITSAELAAGSVIAGKIGALAIVAGDIAASAIESTKIAANAVVAGKIAAGVVTATELAASAVTADKIATGALSVGAFGADPSNMCPNGDFEDLVGNTVGALGSPLHGWSSGATFRTRGDSRYTGATSLESVRAGDSLVKERWSDYVPVIAGRVLKWTGAVRGTAGNDAAANAWMGAYFYDASLASTGSVTNSVTVGASTTWVPISGTLAIPATTTFVRFLCRQSSGGGTTDAVRFDSFQAAYADVDITHAAGNVIIDSTGVTITNGALTLQDVNGTAVMTASGFQGPWSDYIGSGIYNNLYAVATAGALSYGTSRDDAAGHTSKLPYWTCWRSTGSASATVETGSQYPGGHMVTCRFAALGTVSTNNVVLTSDLFPILAGNQITPGWLSNYNVVAGSTLNAQTNVLFYDAAGTYISTASLGPFGYPGPANPGLLRGAAGAIVVPLAARFARVEKVYWETVAHNSANWISLAAWLIDSEIAQETSDYVGFYAHAAQQQQTVTGAKGGNAALASLLTKLAAMGLIVDSST